MRVKQTTTLEIHKLDGHISASRVFDHLQKLPNPVWLDSGFPAANHSRFDILSALPDKVIRTEATCSKNVEEFFRQAQAELTFLGQPASSQAIPFQGGLIGYLGYDLSRETAGLNFRDGSNLPDGHFGLYLWAFIYDHHSQTAQVVFHPHCAAELKTKILSTIEQFEAVPESPANFQLQTGFSPSETKECYLQHIHRIKAYIRAGDVYQVNYAHHFSADYDGLPSRAYLSQRQKHPTPHSAFIGLDGQAVLSHSPEEFIQIQGSEVQTQPIKGTAPRAKNPKIDQRNASVLQSSMKDRAENLMIVDLLRNDLGKSCKPGSISVPRLFELQSFSNVHHLVSEVRGRLVEGTNNLDVLRQCHPGGSVTGAPKRRSMQLIDELETSPRGVYCGSIGFLSCCGRVNTNIAIRTMVADGEKIYCWGGGGIVADSDAEKEYQETLFKVGPMMNSLEEDFLISKNKKTPHPGVCRVWPFVAVEQC